MTQIANPVTLLASPLGEEGHEVAKGWTVVILIMILDVDVTAEGGIIKLIARRAISMKSALRDWLSVSYVTQYPVPPIFSFPLEGNASKRQRVYKA